MRLLYLLPVIALALVLGSAWPPVLGAEVLVFHDGRTLEAVSVREDGPFTHVSFEGGGGIAVPTARILRREVRIPEPVPPPKPPRRPARPSAWKTAAGVYAPLFERVAREESLDPALLTAMARVESAFDPSAVSPKGAQGLLQLMPATAKRFGVDDAFDAEQNVFGGARYLGWLLERFEGRTDLALAGYNAGEGAVDRHRGIPPYPETQDYVTRVLRRLEELGPASARVD